MDVNTEEQDLGEPWAATISGPSGPPVAAGLIPDGWSVRQALFAEVDREALEKALLPSTSGGSMVRQRSLGVAFHPFNFHVASGMEDLSPHHSSCLGTLVDMTVGLGLEDDELYEVLDPLTEHGFDSLLAQVAQDLFSLGTGYIEVVRDPGSRRITGLHHLQCKHTYVVLDGNASGHYHYTYAESGMRIGPSGSSFEFDHAGVADQAMYARFGDADALASMSTSERRIDPEVLSRRRSLGVSSAIPFVDFGEVIVVKMPTSRWTHYGKPAWLSAQPYLDLSCAHLQRAADYMRNRGTPDHLLVILGAALNDAAKTTLKSCLSAGKGRNFGRSAALHIPSASNGAKVQLERFSDGVEGLSFRELHDATALAICSAHRVAPILAGISVPRPMGSANELVQALVLAQLTVVQKVQRLISMTLGCTLGARGKGGIPGMRADSFGLKNLIEHTDIAALDTLARQRDTGTLSRNPSEGLRR